MPETYIEDGLRVGSEGALVLRVKSGAIDVDSPSLAGGAAEVVLALAGAKVGDFVILSPPPGFAAANPDVTYAGATVTGNDELTVLVLNADGAPPTLGTNEQQTVNTGTSSTGTFTLAFEGEGTVLNFDDHAATVQAALRALTTIGSPNVDVTGTDLTTGLTVEFVGTLAGAAQPLLVATNIDLDDVATVAETVAGDGWSSADPWSYLWFDLTR